MKEPSCDFVYPEEEGLPNQPDNAYREVALQFYRTMNIWCDYLIRAESKEVAAWASAYTLGLAICEGVSITDRALMLGVSPQALSKAIRQFQDELKIPNQSYTYAK
jgi:hypothetical protein